MLHLFLLGSLEKEIHGATWKAEGLRECQERCPEGYFITLLTVNLLHLLLALLILDVFVHVAFQLWQERSLRGQFPLAGHFHDFQVMLVVFEGDPLVNPVIGYRG